MIFAVFNGRVIPSRCAIRYMAEWEVTMSELTPDGDRSSRYYFKYVRKLGENSVNVLHKNNETVYNKNRERKFKAARFDERRSPAHEMRNTESYPARRTQLIWSARAPGNTVI
jgi:hypothetical protein